MYVNFKLYINLMYLYMLYIIYFKKLIIVCIIGINYFIFFDIYFEYCFCVLKYNEK